MKKSTSSFFNCWLIFLLTAAMAHAQGTAFTYQGRLEAESNVANGFFDFEFSLYSVSTTGLPTAGPIIVNNVAVSNGLFNVLIDFGSAPFTGSNQWLQINVRPNGIDARFNALAPRQPITPTPYALYAYRAGLGTGSVTTLQIADFAVTGNKIAPGVITDAHLHLPSVTNSLSSIYWRTTGNGNTTAGPNFLGTTDDEPLELKVNQLRALRLEPGTNEVNFIGGWRNNLVTAGVKGATIAGGGGVVDLPSFPSQGSRNEIRAHFGAIGGGAGQLISSGATAAVIAGGGRNIVGADSVFAVIGGGQFNTNEAASAGTIGGGVNNQIQGGPDSSNQGATISGGSRNSIRPASDYAVIGGGQNNIILTNCARATIAGGEDNNIGPNAGHSFVGGGADNDIRTGAFAATLSGGSNNDIDDNASFATIPGGANNTAAGRFTFAAGFLAQANHDGAFVWSDSQGVAFPSLRTNQFRVRAGGGARFDVNNGHWVDMRHTTPIIGVSKLVDTSSGAYLSPGGTWVDSSDRDRKENFSDVNPREILDKVAALPITAWNYKAETDSVRHMGPVAQDFHAAFGVGADDKHIAALDANGVALAAIKGLNQKLEDQLREKESELNSLKQTVAELKEALRLLMTSQDRTQ